VPKKTCRFFLYGTDQPVLESLKGRLLSQFPSLRIAGMQPGYYRRCSPAEMAALAEMINESGAAIVFAGLGGKRQETWMHEQKRYLPMPLIGVGAAFDFHSGRVKQAPPWMQRRGLEWLFRLTQEPRRLWRRYLLLNPVYVVLFLLQYLRIYRPDPSACSAPGATGEA
jgi:N-acetylglucosaminyldiphosphoundecaprenol N-acetyl-beta-D-mannosaminyltransferase